MSCCDDIETGFFIANGRPTIDKTLAANWIYGIDLVDVIPVGAELDPAVIAVDASAGVTTAGSPFVDGTGVYVRVLGGDEEVRNFVTFRFKLLGSVDTDVRTIDFRIVER